MVSRDFNADLAITEGAKRDEEIAEDFAAAGLKDMLAQLLPH